MSKTSTGKPPKRIVIGPQTYKVVLSDDTMVNALMDKQEVFGFCDYNHEEIMVQKSVSHNQKVDTLVHEWLHAILESYGGIAKDEEEELVRFLAPRLVDGMRRNPKLVRYIG